MERARRYARALALGACGAAALAAGISWHTERALVAQTATRAAAAPLAVDVRGHAVVAVIEQRFPRARGWFRQASGLALREVAGGLAPDWETVTHPRVLRRDAAGYRLLPTLPRRADGAMEVAVEGRAGFWVRATALDARPAPAAVADGLVVYPGAYPGGDLVYKLTPTHVDEYVYVPAPEARRTLSFRLETGPGVGALRVAGTVLEVLDREGHALLRAKPPFARDAAGARCDGTLSLDGDRLTLSLDLSGLTFPVLIDPDWSTTGRMVWERFANGAFVLPSGDVLTPGGCTLVVCPAGLGMPSCSMVLSRVELYQSGSGTWRDILPLATARFAYAGDSLADGRPLVAGGCTTARCAEVTGAAEAFDPASETWDDLPPLATPRAYASATRLPGGDVLVAGGCSPAGCVATTEVYEPAARRWRAGPAMARARGLHTATTLGDGRVLVVGGCTSLACGGVLASAEVYDPVAGRWSSAGDLASPRAGHTATVLDGGDVLVAGGCLDRACRPTLRSAERWLARESRWRATAAMADPRHDHSAARLGDGTVLVAGGCVETGTCTRASEVYDPVRDAWTAGSRLSVNRGYPSAAVLRDGRFLLAGGCNENTCLPWAETYPTAAPDGGARPDASAPDAPAADASARDARSPWSDLGVPLSDGGSPLDNGGPAGRDPGGCGCAVPGRAPGGGAFGALGALAAAWGARTRRRRERATG